MTHDPSIERLLRWRLALAEAEAPPPPPAARLLALSRRWWETLPERVHAQLDRLRQMPLAFGYAMTGDERGRAGHPVPVLIAGEKDRDEDVEAYARVLYFRVREGRMRLQFQIEGEAERLDRAFEVTLVPELADEPVLLGRATWAESGAYRVDVDLPAEFARGWSALRVTDRMPFRLMLRPSLADGG